MDPPKNLPIPELRKEILNTLKQNVFPDIALQGIGNLILGFTCMHHPGLNDASKMYIPTDDNTNWHLSIWDIPTIAFEQLDNLVTLNNYIKTLASAIETRILDNVPEKLIAGTLRLYLTMSPNRTIYGAIYYMFAREDKHEG